MGKTNLLIISEIAIRTARTRKGVITELLHVECRTVKITGNRREISMGVFLSTRYKMSSILFSEGEILHRRN
jgi:hypothetical protein